MENNNHGNCEILQTPVQQRRPKTLGIRYSSIKTISKTPYSEIKRRDDLIKKPTGEIDSPRTPFSLSDNNIEKTSKSTGHLSNYNKLSLGRKVLRKKRLHFVESSDLNPNTTEPAVNIEKSPLKVDQLQSHNTRQLRKKLRIDIEANTDSYLKNKVIKNVDTPDTTNLNKKSNKKVLPVPVKDEQTSKNNFSESNSIVQCNKSDEQQRNVVETNIKIDTTKSQPVEDTKVNSNNKTLDNYFDDSDDFPVDVIEDEHHLKKVAELKRLISIWKEGFKNALDDLSKKLDPPREKSEILELLNISGHMINYI